MITSEICSITLFGSRMFRRVAQDHKTENNCALKISVHCQQRGVIIQICNALAESHSKLDSCEARQTVQNGVFLAEIGVDTPQYKPQKGPGT